MSEAWKGGSTAAWRKIRAHVLARDNHRCQLQLDGCRGRADCVHHTVGKAVTGDDPEYLVAACTPCNLKVGDPARHDPPVVPRTQW